MQEELKEILLEENQDGKTIGQRRKSKHKRSCKKGSSVDVPRLAPKLKNQKWSSTESSDELFSNEETDTISRLMRKLDTKVVPKPEKYDSSTGRALSDFFGGV